MDDKAGSGRAHGVCSDRSAAAPAEVLQVPGKHAAAARLGVARRWNAQPGSLGDHVPQRRLLDFGHELDDLVLLGLLRQWKRGWQVTKRRVAGRVYQHGSQVGAQCSRLPGRCTKHWACRTLARKRKSMAAEPGRLAGKHQLRLPRRSTCAGL